MGTFDVKNISKFLLSGDWNMSFSNEKPINFIANLSMVSIKGENLHNHQFINFEIKNGTSKNIQFPQVGMSQYLVQWILLQMEL